MPRGQLRHGEHPQRRPRRGKSCGRSERIEPMNANTVFRCALVVFALALAGPCLAVAQSAQSGQSWTPPRTPWGDPDIQGDYSNKYEQGTPFERPAEFEGRRLADIRGDELAAIIRQRASEVLLNAPFTGGDPVAGNFGGAPAFYDRFEAAKGSRPWFVTDA